MSPRHASLRGAGLPPGYERLIRLVDRFAGRRVAVVGDLIADEFIYGRIDRVSREAPVLILKYDSTEIVPGGAGNAANNAASLGARVRAVGLVGRDDAGRRLVAHLHRRVDRRGIVRLAPYRTPTKTRILAGGVHSVKQQVVRIDRSGSPEITAAARRAVLARALAAASAVDVVVLSDYGGGLATPALAAAILAGARRRGRRPAVLVDSRYDLFRYRRLTACTPNEPEVERLLGVRIDDNAGVLERAGRSVLRRTAMQAVLVTRGSRGMALFEPGRPTLHIPIFGSDQIADVTGAGDTVIATVAVALAAGASFADAARLANYTGGLVVMKRGTATVSAEELRAAIRSDNALKS
jgi:rfaE bifunctional protein kinase chain/domain